MAEQIIRVETKDFKGKIFAALMIVVALVFAWLSVSWQLGNMFASLTAPNDPRAGEIAEFSYGLSPRDPLTNWLRASVAREVFTPENLARSVEGYERMIRFAPFDYRYWLELGRGYEQAERYSEAEKAFRRAVDLAPHYSAPRWSLGNFYLRQGNETEAFAELRRSAEINPAGSQQFFSIVWDYYEQDRARLEQMAGDKADVRAALAKFYAAKERPEDSLRIWNTLAENEKAAHQEVAKLIAQALYDKRFYRSATEFVRQLGIEPQAQIGIVQNGGFESSIPEDAKTAYFNWKIAKLEKMDARTDPTKKKDGNRSLRLSFSAFAGVELKNVGQIVAIEPNKKYALSFWVKTENLKSAGAPTLEIVNTGDDKILAASAAFPTGTNDWSEVKMEFTAPENAEGVVLRIDRAFCGEACLINGTLWLDEFKLDAI